MHVGQAARHVLQHGALECHREESYSGGTVSRGGGVSGAGRL